MMKFNKLFKNWDLKLKGTQFEELEQIYVVKEVSAACCWSVIFSVLSEKAKVKEAFDKYNDGIPHIDNLSKVSLVNKLGELKENNIICVLHFIGHLGDSFEENLFGHETLPSLLMKLDIDSSFLKNHKKETVINILKAFRDKNLFSVLKSISDLDEKEKLEDRKVLSIVYDTSSNNLEDVKIHINIEIENYQQYDHFEEYNEFKIYRGLNVESK